jgi:hypothetical protein
MAFCNDPAPTTMASHECMVEHCDFRLPQPTPVYFEPCEEIITCAMQKLIETRWTTEAKTLFGSDVHVFRELLIRNAPFADVVKPYVCATCFNTCLEPVYDAMIERLAGLEWRYICEKTKVHRSICLDLCHSFCDTICDAVNE